MENLREILKRAIGSNISRNIVKNEKLISRKQATKKITCGRCGGNGWLRKKADFTSEDFGQIFPCDCKATRSQDIIPNLFQIGGFNKELLSNMSFQKFDLNGNLKLDQRQKHSLRTAVKICKIFAKQPEGWLFITGTHGSGKTHLALACAVERLKQKDAVFIVFVPALLDELRSSFGVNKGITYENIIEKLRSVELLVLDDLGSESGTEWSQEKLYQILVFRYNLRLPTIITSSLSTDEIELNKEAIGSRLKDQMIVQEIVLSLSDYRDQSKKHKNF